MSQDKIIHRLAEIYRDALPNEKCSNCGQSQETYPQGTKIVYDNQQKFFFHTRRGCKPETCQHSDIDVNEYDSTCKECDSDLCKCNLKLDEELLKI